MSKAGLKHWTDFCRQALPAMPQQRKHQHLTLDGHGKPRAPAQCARHTAKTYLEALGCKKGIFSNRVEVEAAHTLRHFNSDVRGAQKQGRTAVHGGKDRELTNRSKACHLLPSKPVIIGSDAAPPCTRTSSFRAQRSKGTSKPYAYAI